MMSAKLIDKRSLAIFKRMYNVVLKKKCKRPEDARLVHRQQRVLHHRESRRMMLGKKRLQDDYAISGGTYALSLKNLFYQSVVHSANDMCAKLQRIFRIAKRIHQFVMCANTNVCG